MIDRTLKLAEKAFRTTARYAYAINQSRAKVVFDPIYYAVASTLLRGDPPLSERLRATRIEDNLFFAYRTQSRRLQYYIEDWDFSEARPELLTQRQRQMMHTVALGETSGAAVADGFLRAFRTMPELAAFFGTWFVEELNHFMGYHLYLERMGERWPAQRGLDVAEVEFLPYADDPMEVAAANMYQELLGFLVYRSLSKQVRDPFLAKMLLQFAKDEMRHYKFYQQVVARQIQRQPSFRKQVLRVILKATSPYNQVSGGARNVLDHLEGGAFYFRKREFDFFLDQVEYLLGVKPEGFFRFYFKDVIDPCAQCGKQTFECACEHYDVDGPVQRRNPDWWKQVSRQGGEDLPLEAWTRELMERARTRAAS
ncbi:MAG: acyl-ACP desaturase [Myxococcales bacterium]